MTVVPTLHVGNAQPVAYSATSVSLFGANPAARYRSVQNISDKACYVLFNGTAVSSTLHTKKLAAGEFWQFPDPLYNNQTNIIWEAAGTGGAVTTEY